ncbi:MAG: hypothetical protein E7452_06650 [Ruminococcaceae bacterium]|nr:hypothetical protein [Oscillospiraceae bacterium]
MSEHLLDEFLHPSAEFSPMPFWFWNDELDETEIAAQMAEFRAKGVDGFVIHPRLGLPESIPYMGERWLTCVRFAVDEAARTGMRVILYDEAMYPSGSCHGEVVRKNPEFTAQGLFLREERMDGETVLTTVTADGAVRFLTTGPTGGTIRGVHFGEDDGQPGAPPAADLLNPAAVAKFIELTHERYYRALGDTFGKTVIGIFTDEPSLRGRGAKKGALPWTHDFAEELAARGVTLEELAYLFTQAELPRAKEVREIYDHLVYDRLRAGYYGQIAAWCRAHEIAFLGHPGGSTDIGLLKEFDIPCQDIVWRYVAPGEPSALVGGHSTMGKCASDSARHAQKRRNGNECFGCCGHIDDPFKFTYEDMKWYLDWLFVRGCNLVIPHAFYYSVRGERKNERPPEVGTRSEFWDRYKTVSDYVKRCSAINTDSVNVTDVAILCVRDDLPYWAAKVLFEHQIEFNYLEADLLSGCLLADGACTIAAQRYRVIIADGALPAETEAFLSRFAAVGGTVLRFADLTEAAFAQAVRTHSQTVLAFDPAPDLRISRVRKHGADVVFCANEGEETVSTTLHHPVSAVLDAEEGTITPCSGDRFSLTLSPRKSLHLILA